MTEEFKDIPKYEGSYQISNTGKVFSLISNKVIKPIIHRQGYLKMRLKGKYFYVHRLVMLTFIGPSKLTVNHKDGDKTNNNLDNLEYVTQSENNYHAFRNKLNLPHLGSTHGNAKLTEKEVIEIRELYKNGKNQTEISKIYNISNYTIHNVVNRKSWRHI